MLGRGGVGLRRSAAALVIPIVLVTAGCTNQPEPDGDGRSIGVSSTARLAATPSRATADGSIAEGPIKGRIANPVASVEDLVGVWRTWELDGRDVAEVRDPEGAPLTVAFYRTDEGFGWTATDGCNSYSGPISITSDGRFRAGDETVTARACLPADRRRYPRNPGAVIEADRAELTPWGSLPTRRLALVRGDEVLAVFSEMLDDPDQM